VEEPIPLLAAPHLAVGARLVVHAAHILRRDVPSLPRRLPPQVGKTALGAVRLAVRPARRSKTRLEGRA
jgi:hypothetical protein